MPGAIRIHRALNRWGWRGFLAIVFLTLFGPLAILVAFSFNDSNILAFPFDGLTTKWYSLALQDPSLREALLNSTAVAFIVAPLCLVLGTLAAFGLTRFRFRGRGAIGGLVGAPLGAAVADRRHRGADGLRESQRGPEPEDRDRHADDLHVPVGDGDRGGAVVPVPAGAGRGRDRPGVQPARRCCGTSSCRTSRRRSPPPAIFAFTWSFNNYEISAFTIGFQQTFPIWVYSSVRNPDHTAVVNAISTLISAVQVVLIYLALRLLRSRGGTSAIAMTEMPLPVDGGKPDGDRHRLPRRCPRPHAPGEVRGRGAGRSASCSRRSRS